MAAVRGALSGAPGSLIPGLLTRVRSPPFSFSSDVWRLHQSRSLSHEKNHPQSPNHLFILAENIHPETLLIQASETLASLNAMTTDLAFELEGAHRHKLLAAQQLIVLGELLVERVLNTQPFTTQTPQP